MSSIELRNLSQQGFSSAASTSNTRPQDTRGAEVSGPSTQQQQRPSQERARPRPQAIVEQAQQAVQQVSTQRQQAPQGNSRSTWSTIVKERGFGVTVFALIIGIVMMGPTIGSYSTGVWSTAQTYQSWCQSERNANHTLTRKCRLIVDLPLPPPPGLGQVFKEVGRSEAVAIVTPRTPLPSTRRPLTDEEREKIYAFIRGPIGSGIWFAFFGFFVLMMQLENKNLKWFYFVGVFCMFHITRKASLIVVASNVALLMNWAHWLRKVGVKGPSWSSLAVLPILYGVGYMHEKSTTTQIAISIISALVAGDDYSHNVIPLMQILGRSGYGS